VVVTCKSEKEIEGKREKENRELGLTGVEEIRVTSIFHVC